MSNPYFRFKQFVVQQDRCAMKVCTDSCILGAWTAQRLSGVNKILDIGTGTGLLPLMLAQKSGAYIETIETDPESAAQARENMRQSPWADRIRLIEGDVRLYAFQSMYDFIITNPPFYESDLPSPEQKKNKARHGDSLQLDELILILRSRLKQNGMFSILLPFHRKNYFEELALANGFFLYEQLTIRQTPAHAPFRSISLFGFQKPESMMVDEWAIKTEEEIYRPQFRELMEEYY
jgi:tRNA1Val (adenine37-N6)-methyltransferase